MDSNIGGGLMTNHMNFYKGTISADYLDILKKIIMEEIAGKTSGEVFTPNYIIPFEDIINFSDTTSIDFSGTPGAFIVTEGKDQLKLWSALDDTVNDNSDNGNNGTVTGTTTYVGGTRKNAFSFNGATYITVNNGADFNFLRTNPFSIALWWTPTTFGTEQVLVSKKNNDISVGYTVFMNTSNYIVFEIESSTETMSVSSSPQSVEFIPKPFFVCVTYDGSGNQSGMKVYINTLQGTGSPLAFTTSMSTSAPVVIGAYGDFTKKISGVVDEVRIYNLALTQDQVTNLRVEQISKYANPAIVGFCDV